MTGFVQGLRSFLFNVGWYPGTAVIAVLGTPILLLPRAGRGRLGRVLDPLLPAVAQGHLPAYPSRERPGEPAGGPVIIASKHQSSWETLAYTLLFPDAAIVLKRELLFIPVVGWAMARAGKSPSSAATGLGAARPVAPGQGGGRRRPLDPDLSRRHARARRHARPYQVGTAALYRQLGVPVVPVALNSGVFWGRRKFIKWPGVIEVEILPPIAPGLGRETFMTTLRERIEGATKRLVSEAKRL